MDNTQTEPRSTEPERTTPELEFLLGHLDGQRDHVLRILEGLTDEQLRRRVLPSGWHCLGMLQHLALSDERYWFRCVVDGESTDYFPAGPQADWQVEADQSADSVKDRYRAEIARSNAILREVGLDASPKRPDPDWAKYGMEFPDVRSVVLHMITETSVHAGHLDAVRELIDGRQHIVL